MYRCICVRVCLFVYSLAVLNHFDDDSDLSFSFFSFTRLPFLSLCFIFNDSNDAIILL